jgi:thioredoxin-related protein
MNLLTFIIAGILSFANPDWLTNFEKAKTEAQASHKQILLNFSGSDWCGPCIKLNREVFQNKTFSDYAEGKLVLVNADFPRQKKNKLSKEQTKMNETLADQYNKAGTFPLNFIAR